MGMAFAAAIGVAGHAVAGTVLFTGSGTWGDSAPSTPYSAPDESWSFSFDLPNPIATNPTTQATDFVYDLSGSPVSTPLLSVTFFPVANAGLFDLNFTDGTAVSIYGADVGSSLTLMPGTYPATSGIDDVLHGTGWDGHSDCSAGAADLGDDDTRVCRPRPRRVPRPAECCRRPLSSR